MTRETYYTALFALLQSLQTAGTVQTADRRVRFLNEMGAAELPALFMAVDRQTLQQRRGLPPRHQLGARVFLYAANPDRHTAAGIALNGLLDALEAAIAPPAGADVQTLGGLVSHAWIEGPVEVFEGPQGERSAAIVTVQMLVP
jgi:hypothetical protein